MSFSFVPKQMCRSIYQINLEALRDQGIKVIFADLDNTLAKYSERTAGKGLMAWLERVERAGLKVFVVSNSRKSTRADRFCQSAGLDYIKHAGKPKRKGFLRAMALCGVTAEECVMVGDQIFTDILGANRCGILSILVRPIANDTIFRKLRHAIEAPFRAFCKDRRRW